MGKSTSTDRAISAEPNRRKRWEMRMADRGYRRMVLYVRDAQVPAVEALKLALRDLPQDVLDSWQQELAELVLAGARGVEMQPEFSHDPVADAAFLRAAAAAIAIEPLDED